ncbi:hypothetical protein F4808DRAFT_430785 [Astrocystis sublimbata]|nr:hypothetical protein F4808DRAFT_430785 [Astrocystis sublimbata]
MSITTAIKKHVDHSRTGNDITEDEPSQPPTQNIAGRYISSTKLVHMLKSKFGANEYHVHMAHNTFCIKAPRQLSSDEIAECRR